MRETRQDAGTPDGGGVVRAPRGSGGDPPDVIEVVFPAEPAAAASHRARGPADARSWPERPLLYGGLAIAGVALATLLAWVVWPASTAAPDAYRPLPAPSYTPLPLPRTTTPVRKRPSATAGAPRRTAAAPLAPQPASRPASTAATPVDTAPARPSAPGTTVPRTLRPGDSGPDVTRLQQLLFAQGFTYVSQTGVYDGPTERGVAQAQQDRGLTCDPRGVYGPCTRAALTS
ncbi:Putative peptidoglycan binding domain-containing protein [Actinacidiphila rubida]|uniref:Putative peptidoglycan binding domain-containing protein n=1 Tax=Actinacidiphila rubida TaxID=310780 RepID=A0A1H8TZS7_9ACTN|nr:peptidoglycan-binding domain-containing protein [Actinacidiphila rubida]SEO96063.1 Putative peptidoglycan binding domain-containing protein [Actinacidiphila rubida]